MRTGRRSSRGLAALACAIAAVACAREVPRAPAPSAPPVWRYEVAFSASSERATVVAELPAGSDARLAMDPAAWPFVDDLRIDDVAVRALPPPPAAACERGCRVAYSVRLGAMADAVDRVEVAARVGAALVALPDAFLVHPAAATDDARYRVRAHADDGAFACGLDLAKDDLGAYEAPALAISNGPFCAMGRLRARAVDLDGARLDVLVDPALRLPAAVVDAWVDRSARAVADHLGAFPTSHAMIAVAALGGARVGFGQARGGGGASVLVRVGAGTPVARLEDDWVLVHELLHLAWPWPGPGHAWIEEGVATYVEPIVRARRGLATPDDVWGPFLDKMHFGLPKPGEGGLEDTPTWGRTYWGGALFFLLADLGIRDATRGARSLDDALRGIHAAGGALSVHWPIERTLAAADRATGTTVMADLYARMGRARGEVDLDALFARLGVKLVDGHVVYDDRAPLAAVRRAIDGSGQPTARSTLPKLSFDAR